MAGRRPYRTRPLAELEKEVADREAVSRRIPAALKEALEAARAAVQQDASADITGQADDDSGYHEECELDADELAARAAAERASAEARRNEFATRVAKLIDSGFTEAQAVEALTSEFPAEVAEYTEMAFARAPRRDPSEVDMKTGELKAARPAAEPGKPYAQVSATPYPVTFYRPVLKVVVPQPDGSDTIEELTCEHVDKYGHGSEDAALKCARSMAYKRGLRLP